MNQRGNFWEMNSKQTRLFTSVTLGNFSTSLGLIILIYEMGVVQGHC